MAVKGGNPQKKQMKLWESIPGMAKWVIVGLGTVIAAYLFLTGLFISQTFFDYEVGIYPGQPFPFLKDNWALLAFCLAAALSMLTLLLRAVDGKYGKAIVYVLLAAEMTAAFCISLWWIGAIQAVPTDDAGMIYFYAKAFASGDFSGLAEGQYMSYYQQQLSLTCLLSWLVKHGTGEAYWYYQLLNAVCAPIAGLAGFCLVRLQWNSRRTETVYLALMAVCFPFYFHTTIVYGEVVSITFCLWACYFAARLLKNRGRAGSVVCLLASLFLAVWIRMNSLVVGVAILLCLAVRMLQNRKAVYLWGAGAVIAASIFPTILVNAIYSEHLEGKDSIPPAAYIAMGLQDGTFGVGSHNGYEVNVFFDAGYDAELAGRMSMDKIREILSDFGENPGEGLKFFNTKILWQWHAPTFMCLVSNRNFGRDIEGLAFELYFGKLREPFFQALNLYQSFAYLGLLAAFLAFWRRERGVENLLPAVVFLGGFFFSIIWEAKPRYVLPYFVMLLPLAAYGIEAASAWLSEMAKRICRKRGNQCIQQQ